MEDTMDTKIKEIEKSDTWEVVDPPESVTPIGVKWIFKTKVNESGQLEKY